MNYLELEARAREARQELWMLLLVGLFATAVFSAGWYLGAGEIVRDQCRDRCSEPYSVIDRGSGYAVLDVSKWKCECRWEVE